MDRKVVLEQGVWVLSSETMLGRETIRTVIIQIWGTTLKEHDYLRRKRHDGSLWGGVCFLLKLKVSRNLVCVYETYNRKFSHLAQVSGGKNTMWCFIFPSTVCLPWPSLPVAECLFLGSAVTLTDRQNRATRIIDLIGCFPPGSLSCLVSVL